MTMKRAFLEGSTLEDKYYSDPDWDVIADYAWSRPDEVRSINAQRVWLKALKQRGFVPRDEEKRISGILKLMRVLRWGEYLYEHREITSVKPQDAHLLVGAKAVLPETDCEELEIALARYGWIFAGTGKSPKYTRPVCARVTQ